MTQPERQRMFEAAVPFLWLAYIVAPIGGWGLFPGRPLGFGASAALAAVCWIWFVRGTLGFARVVTAALIAKVLIGSMALAPRGLEARYYANAEFSGAPERSTDSRARDITRVDRTLSFGEDRDTDLPLAFFNETERFNFYRDTEPARETLPFSVVWQGMWKVTPGGPQRIYVRAPGGTAQVVVDRFHATIPATDEWSADVTLPPGFHRISVSLSTPQGSPRRFEAGRIIDGRPVPFDETVVFRRAVTAPALMADAAWRWTSTAIDALLIVWLAVAVLSAVDRLWRTARASFEIHATLALLWALAIVDALVFARPAVGRMITLSGGNDWLTYEALARDIGLNGLLMLAGETPGHGRAFYYQPLYPYFLAACHWVFGEGLFGPYFVQRLLAGATVIVLWRTTANLFGERAGGAGLVAAWVVVYEKLAYWSPILLSEVVFVPLVCVWMLLLARAARTRSVTTVQAIGLGIAGGAATLARSTVILAWPIAAAATWFSIGRGDRRWPATAIMMATMVGVTSLATTRNWIVSHTFVPVATSGNINLAIGNAPPMRIVVPPGRTAAYNRLGLDENTRAVVEYARQEPRSFMAGLGRKALYTLGWYGGLVPDAGVSSFYIATWATALAGLGLVWSGSIAGVPSGPPWATMIPLALAMTHFAAVVIFFPHVYGDRLIIPFYILLVPYAGVWAMQAYERAATAGRDGANVVLWVAAFALSVWPLAGGALWFFDVPVIVGALLLGGIAASGLPRVSTANWPYAAYAIAMFAWLLQAGTAQAAGAVMAESLFLALALGSGVVIAGDRAIRTVAILVGGFCTIAAMLVLARSASVEALRSTFSAVSFEGLSVLAALLGAAALLAAAAGRPVGRRARELTWIAGAGLAISAIAQLGITVYPERSFLRGMRARVGIAGALAYALVWIRLGWPSFSAGSVPVSLLQGIVAGIFVAELFGVNLHPPGGTALLAIGMICGVVEQARAGHRTDR